MSKLLAFKKKNHSFLLGICGVVATCFLFLFPVIRYGTTHLTSRADGIFIAWTIDWVSRALITGENVYHAPIFHPYTNTLAYSDPFFASGVANIPLHLLTTNIVLQHNIHLVVGTLLTAVAFYLLAYELTKHATASVLGSLFFTFSSLHFHYIVHLHTFLIAGLPLTLYFLTVWLKTQRPFFLLAAAVCFVVQALNSPLTGFFIIAICLPTVLVKSNFSLIRKHAAFVASCVCISLAVLVLAYAPYFTVSKQFSYTRSIRDTAAFAHSFERLVNIELLLVYGLLLATKVFSPRVVQQTFLPKKTMMIVALIGALLMLGPVLKSDGSTVKAMGIPIPLPYALAYYIIPGFQAFRASSRWIIVFDFGLSLLLATGLARWKKSTATKSAVLAGMIGILWLSQVPQLELHQIPSPRTELLNQISAHQKGVLAEFPIYIWSMNPYATKENDRLLFQALHHARLYNGMSGFTPPEREQSWLTMSQKFPNDQVIDSLVTAGVTQVLVHFDEYDRLARNNYRPSGITYLYSHELTTVIAKQPRLKEQACANSMCLYTIIP